MKREGKKVSKVLLVVFFALILVIIGFVVFMKYDVSYSPQPIRNNLAVEDNSAMLEADSTAMCYCQCGSGDDATINTFSPAKDRDCGSYVNALCIDGAGHYKTTVACGDFLSPI